MQKLICRLS